MFLPLSKVKIKEICDLGCVYIFDGGVIFQVTRHRILELKNDTSKSTPIKVVEIIRAESSIVFSEEDKQYKIDEVILIDNNFGESFYYLGTVEIRNNLSNLCRHLLVELV